MEAKKIKTFVSQDLLILNEHHLQLNEILEDNQNYTLYSCFSNIYHQIFYVEKLKMSTEVEEGAYCLSKCDHPNIIRIYEHFTNEKYSYFVFEPYQVKLLDYIKNHGVPSLPTITVFSKSIADIFRYLQIKGFSFSQFNPKDFVIDQYGRIKYCNYHLQRSNQIEISNTSSNDDFLTAFLPPEAFSNENYEATSANIWSYGVFIYFLSLGKLPWIVSQHSDIINAIKQLNFDNSSLTMSSRLGDVIKRCLVENPKERPTIHQILEMPFFSQKQVSTHLSSDRLKLKSKRKTSMPSLLLPHLGALSRHKNYI